MALRTPVTGKIDDEMTERMRVEHESALKAIRALPAASLTPLAPVDLVDTVATPIAHQLGRYPTMVIVSPPVGAASAGRIDEIRSSAYDRTKVVVLKATGYGATIQVTPAVM